MIKWTKKDVIERFREAMQGSQGQPDSAEVFRRLMETKQKLTENAPVGVPPAETAAL